MSEGEGLVEVCIELMGRPLTDVGIVQVVSLSGTAQGKQSNALVLNICSPCKLIDLARSDFCFYYHLLFYFHCVTLCFALFTR